MASSKKPDASVPLAPQRRTLRRRFTPDALARVLSEALHLTPHDPLYVAYSGGMDSHVLLHALVQLQAQTPWRVTALHVDHGLQLASAEWARHCAAVCAALHVPYYGERVAVRDIAARGLEDAARVARYAALARQFPPGGVLLTAHHQDDQAETLLLQLLRGAGVPGLAAMPAMTEFAHARLARPLLGFERAALADYATAQQLRWIEDASNTDERLARNFLRRRLWPTIAARWPQAGTRIARAARHQAQAAQLLDQLGAIDLASIGEANGELRISALQQLAPERQANAVRCWVRTRGLDVPGERVLQQILARVRHCPQTRHALVRWRGAEVRRYRDRLALASPRAVAPPRWETTWDPAIPLDIPDSGWRLRAQTATGAGLSRARLAGNVLHVRLRRGGERCRLRGHSRKVKKLLQEAGIPPWERAHLPLLYVGDELAAIGDRWVCEPYAARADEPGLVLVFEVADAR